ncbi:MAG: universal stress protein [Planctomycetia bacterium]
MSLRILHPTDGSANAHLALQECAAWGWPAGSVLRVVSVVRPWPFVGDPLMTGAAVYSQHLLDEERRAAADLRAGEDLVRSAKADLRFEARRLDGDAAQRILAEAQEWGADYIFMGAHGRSALATLALGSVARQVVEHAPCSVLVVRPRRQRLDRH